MSVARPRPRGGRAAAPGAKYHAADRPHTGRPAADYHGLRAGADRPRRRLPGPCRPATRTAGPWAASVPLTYTRPAGGIGAPAGSAAAPRQRRPRLQPGGLVLGELPQLGVRQLAGLLLLEGGLQ